MYASILRQPKNKVLATINGLIKVLMTLNRFSNTAKGAKHAKNEFYHLCALCVPGGELSGNEGRQVAIWEDENLI